MANRKHVIRIGPAIVAALAFLTVACSQAGPQATEFRGRVIDQDTGHGIPAAIVVGKYMGSRGFEGSSSCNRVESAVSDQEGWFTMSIDGRDGRPLMEAYHRGYKLGKNLRKAWPGVDGNVNLWQVVVYQWNGDNTTSTIVRTEPTIYKSEAEALAASRERMDLYLKPFVGDTMQRLREIHRMPIAASCGGTYYTSAGPVPYFRAILQEQIELGDDEASLKLLRGAIADAELQRARAGRKP